MPQPSSRTVITTLPAPPVVPVSVATPIQLGMTTQGTLQPGDVVDGSGSFVDDHVLALAPGQDFTVIARGGPSMTGRSTLDVVLQLLVDGQEIGRDDDSAGDRNARLMGPNDWLAIDNGPIGKERGGVEIHDGNPQCNATT